MTLILPPEADPFGNGTQITPAMHLEAVDHQLGRASCLQDVTAVEADLWDAHRTRMRLGVVRPWINAAFAMCAQRRHELTGETPQPSPAVPGHVALKDV